MPTAVADGVKVEAFAGERILAMDPRTEKATRSCPACKSVQRRDLGIKNKLEIVSCLECESIYTPYSPWYSSTYYYVDYHDHGDSTPNAYVRARLHEITSEFAPFRQNNRLLDVGCGAGALLEAASRNGWSVQGVDVSASAVEHGRSLGFEVFHGELQEAKLPDQYFDVITAGELLEHVFDPQLVMNEIARLLRPGGLLWTTTPHSRGLSARLLGIEWGNVRPPEHLQLFSSSGLRLVLERAGFRDLTLRTEGGNPFEIWHALKSRRASSQRESEAGESENAREALDSWLSTTVAHGRSRRVLKNAVNTFLNLSRLGDSLKVVAIKSV